ncbi:hypothetical protein SKAU_G00063710 [Synaphobranchus kaupii]|uniref:Uncharacterized protein n=1 Tax=Synaphobranchus kaupii TaxID=118154 RepID=A0A9Q1G5V9_SYNKA|nr:hypothetical protein SKAU_G00063710 [Synaphobranchus kaupii]
MDRLGWQSGLPQRTGEEAGEDHGFEFGGPLGLWGWRYPTSDGVSSLRTANRQMELCMPGLSAPVSLKA